MSQEIAISKHMITQVYVVLEKELEKSFSSFLELLPPKVFPSINIGPYLTFPESFKSHGAINYYLKYLILTNKLFEARSLYKSIWLNRWIQYIPYEILIRLNLLNDSKIEKEKIKRQQSNLLWVNQYFETGKDSIYNAVAQKIISDSNLFLIRTICKACNQIFPVSLDQCFIDNNEEFLCPYCLAKLQYSSKNLRLEAEKFIVNEISRIPHKKPEEYSIETLNSILHKVTKLKKICTIRFGCFRVDGAHIVSNSIFFNFLKEIGYDDSNTVDFIWSENDWAPWNSFAFELNIRFFKYTHPIARAISSKISFDSFMSLNRKLLHPTFTGIFFHTKNSRKLYKSVAKKYFTFTDDEIELAETKLMEMGIPKGHKYACLAFRSAKYHEEFSSKEYSRNYIHYNQSAAHRNANLESIIFVIKKLVEYGYYVLLMGKEEPPKELCFEHDKFIKYSKNYRTEFLDMYYFFHSDILVGLGGSNAFTFGHCRGNCLSLDFSDIWIPESVYNMTLTLPKHIYNTKEDRFQSIKERILTKPTTDLDKAIQYKEKFIDNTLEDIEKTIDEFIEIVQGRKMYTKESDKMHKAFYDYYQLTPLAHQIDHHGGRISSAFLNHYKNELLPVNT